MNRIFGLLLLLASFLCLSFSDQSEFSEIHDASKLLDEIKAVSTSTTSISANFIEEKHLALFDKPQFSNGQFYYQAENKMRWEQIKPFEYVILIQGESLKIKDNGVEKKVNSKNRMISQVNTFMMSLIQGNYTDTRYWDIKCFASANEYKIQLTPKNRMLSKVYRSLEMFFDKTDYRLQSIFFLEPSGDNKTMTFSDQKYNQELSPNIFSEL